MEKSFLLYVGCTTYESSNRLNKLLDKETIQTPEFFSGRYESDRGAWDYFYNYCVGVLNPGQTAWAEVLDGGTLEVVSRWFFEKVK